jgi:hypothetical protein
MVYIPRANMAIRTRAASHRHRAARHSFAFDHRAKPKIGNGNCFTSTAHPANLHSDPEISPAMIDNSLPAGLRHLGLAVLTAGALIALPGAASAECGHYVTILNQQAGIDENSREGHQSPGPLPCRGPSCSHHEPIPLTPAPVSVNPTPDAKAAMDGTGDLDRDESHRLGLEPLPLPLEIEPSSVFHPPRD